MSLVTVAMSELRSDDDDMGVSTVAICCNDDDDCDTVSVEGGILLIMVLVSVLNKDITVSDDVLLVVLGLSTLVVLKITVG